MDLRANGCYYHPGRLAVATCARCGVGICRDCLVRDENGTILCYQCGNEKLKQEHKEYRKWLKETGGRFKNWTEFIIPSIIGVLIIVLAAALIHIEAVPPITDKRDMVGMTYMLFSIPFGYTIWNDLLTPKYETIWNKVFGTWCTKVAFSLISGWIILPFVLIRFIVRKIRPNNHKQKKKEGKYEK